MAGTSFSMAGQVADRRDERRGADDGSYCNVIDSWGSKTRPSSAPDRLGRRRRSPINERAMIRIVVVVVAVTMVLMP
jgi:hypothetical protein